MMPFAFILQSALGIIANELGNPGTLALRPRPIPSGRSGLTHRRERLEADAFEIRLRAERRIGERIATGKAN
jgi:hypothetical protein